TGQPREESADGLDAILRIAGNADHRLVDPRNFRRATRRRGCHCVTHGTSRLKMSAMQGELAAEDISVRHRCLVTVSLLMRMCQILMMDLSRCKQAIYNAWAKPILIS